MKEMSLLPPDEEEEYTEECPFCGEEIEVDDIVYIRDGSIIGCQCCIREMELCDWAEKNYISKEDYLVDKADMERDER